MVEALFYAFFVGTGLGFLYDLMRLFRLSFGGSLFFDLLFWLITSFVSFSYLLIFNDGAIKGIFLAFIFVGFTFYIISMGKISLPLEKRIAKKVKIRLKKVKKSLENFKKVLQLPRMLYYNIKEIIKKPNRKKHEGDEFGKGRASLKSYISANTASAKFLSVYYLSVFLHFFLSALLIKMQTSAGLKSKRLK